MNVEQCALTLLEENFKHAMEEAVRDYYLMADNDIRFTPSSSNSPHPPLLEPELLSAKSPEKSKSPSVRRRGKARIYNEVARCYTEDEVDAHSKGWRKLRTRNLSRKGQVREFECPLSRRHTKCRMGMRIETHLNEADGKLVHIVYHTSDTAHNHLEDIPPPIDSIKLEANQPGPPTLTPNLSNLAALQERAASAEHNGSTPCLSEDSVMSTENATLMNQLNNMGVNAALIAMDEQRNWVTEYLKRRWNEMSQESRSIIVNTVLFDVTQQNLIAQQTPVSIAPSNPPINLALLNQFNPQVVLANKNLFFNFNQ
ncbi:unnamed protein product [Bursaphelenchus xylophilus]|uniref:(pine wood nematode) hypothetical protein n=1 Tax=Bursaphelenchus xylophilus TaxID=6326 RepID=A0A1I7RLZ8_BURXY|nr:unnamed protein product [Bursaphelenchus xylophilus]CAG9113396.1 unnamed protein product [Bursaphelenchus xylophilus]